MSPARRQLRPQTRKVNRGRGGHSYFLDGVKCDGVTTLLNGGVPKPALTAWAAREVAEFVAGRRGILQALNDEELIDLCKGAPFRERDAAANRGTEVHAYAARLGAGERDIQVPEELLGHVDAYIAWEAAWQPNNVRTELTVINRQHRYMGTLDWLGELADLGTTLLDIKTGRSGIFAEAGLQAIAYGHCESILEQDGSETPMPHVDTYAGLWLGRDDYEFSILNVGDADFRNFLYAAETARWMTRRAGDRAVHPVVGAALLPPNSRANLTVVKEETA